MRAFIAMFLIAFISFVGGMIVGGNVMKKQCAVVMQSMAQEMIEQQMIITELRNQIALHKRSA